MRVILLWPLLLSVAASAAPAAPAAKKPRSVFQGMDADKNGKISEPEYRRSVSNWFNEVDENQDMKITAQETAAAASRRFRLMDADNDSAISRGEYLRYYCGAVSGDPKPGPKKGAFTGVRFLDQDPNRDRAIDPAECALFRGAEFSRMDLDRSGKLTLDEVNAEDARQFRGADANGDESLSSEEWLAYFVGAKKRPAPTDGKSLPDPDAP